MGEGQENYSLNPLQLMNYPNGQTVNYYSWIIPAGWKIGNVVSDGATLYTAKYYNITEGTYLKLLPQQRLTANISLLNEKKRLRCSQPFFYAISTISCNFFTMSSGATCNFLIFPSKGIKI